jgi:hypothetical protein
MMVVHGPAQLSLPIQREDAEGCSDSPYTVPLKKVVDFAMHGTVRGAAGILAKKANQRAARTGLKHN